MDSSAKPKHTYPLDAWCIRETSFDTASHFLDETLFALGNGYIGLRGSYEDGYSGPAGSSLDGTYLNGFYDSETIHYPEAAYGLAKTNQFMLNVPNGKGIGLWIDDERFDLLQGTLEKYERTLDFRTGVLQRKVQWTSNQGRRVAIVSRRMVCFEHKHLYAIEYVVTPLNFSGRVQLVASLDGDVKNIEAGDDPRIGSAVSGPALQLVDSQQEEHFSALLQRTSNSGFSLVSATATELVHAGAHTPRLLKNGQRLEQSYEVHATEGQAVRLTKFGCYFSSRDYPGQELMSRSRDLLAQAQATGFHELLREQEQYLANFWQQADVEIAGDDALQQGIHFNQFHLLQSVGRDGKTNISAKGVTGEGYEGHYFWDTEIYIFPFFLYSKPEIARKLLEYRYAGLDQARARARQMSHQTGALYPWRTIAGEECSAYFPAGTAQYHINADIAYSIKLYVEASGDHDYLLKFGAEILMETARIWLGIGSYDRDGRFCINQVTGPDEYTALVNNNYYTNAMARMHLNFAADVAERIGAAEPEQFARIAALMALDPAEPAAWRRAAQLMRLPYDAALQIHAQDDSFLSKKVWDFANTPKEKYPLLLNYHPMVIYRHQVCKQADVVLALLLLSDEFSAEDKQRDFDYYEPLTTHDSSLSSCIYSIIASEIGYHDKAYDFFMETARLDLDDTHGNTHYGVHTAAMAGTWMGVAYGFAGMRVAHGALRFAPTLPAKWRHYTFKIHFKGALLQVRVEPGRTEYRLLQGDALRFSHHAEALELTLSAPVLSRA
ncbi:glycoside hydrolase family 65 protein [Janthinobacterium agaricidamnosum]|uniref:Glycosyl hydrolase family 65, C-terminal domain protein n=1 Tax=Janthinobacterium agaricidamnosum NBRC 102515 = DSM 9628 TaxID=1349767 RepID=W0V803_9BURK|nr:glycosyl hydrolase family 65 protein [Janthinobacterium agaricidamnosum]CDG84006.1 glycosyl hydrolase family 65, C-terminal domain protein [Janthinobacterium agaricidamnosum NBRC 102515 = DSM 9628]